MTQDFEHEYMGFGRVPSKCRVMIISRDGRHLICFEDLGIGTSVTNASEQLATEIVGIFNYDPKDCRFFETYNQYDYTSFDFDEITYDWEIIKEKSVAKIPKWKPAPEEIRNLFTNQYI